MDKITLTKYIVYASILLLYSCCRTTQLVAQERDVSQVRERLDSLLADFASDPDCLGVLDCMSHLPEYLPEGERFDSIYSKYLRHDDGDVLRCVYRMVLNGDREAEAVLLGYFRAYYRQIQKEGKYNKGYLFGYLIPCRSVEYREFLLELADSDYKGYYNGYMQDSQKYIRLFGQENFLASIKTIYGIEEVYPLNWRIQTELVNSPEYGNIRKEDGDTNLLVWRKAYLPVIEKAMKEDAIEYIGYGEELILRGYKIGYYK